MALRPDLQIIAKWIRPGSRVLDLGCGDGALLKHLRTESQVSGYGVEIDIENIARCIDNDVNVIHSDIDAGLSEFEDASFDYVVMTQTLQAIRHPDRLLREILRVGREGIVTLPNFGHWHSRWQILQGRMPVTRALPDQWYNTPNIHLCTVKDFEALCREQGVRYLQRALVNHNYRTTPLIALRPNLLAAIALYRLGR